MSCYFPQQCFSSSKFIYAKVSEQVKRNEYDHEICYAQIKGAKMNKKKTKRNLPAIVGFNWCTQFDAAFIDVLKRYVLGFQT